MRIADGKALDCGHGNASCADVAERALRLRGIPWRSVSAERFFTIL